MPQYKTSQTTDRQTTYCTIGSTDSTVGQKLAVFHGIPLNSVPNSLSYDIVRFKIEVGVEEKFMYKNVTQHGQLDDRHSSSKAVPRRHLSDLDLTINMLGLCYPSNLLFEYSASTLATACRARVDHLMTIIRTIGAFATRSSQITLRTCYK